MKKIILLIIILFPLCALANDSIRFVDLNNLILTSEAGKDIDNKIKKLSDNELSNFEKKKKLLVDKENKLITKKNILEVEVFKNELENLKKEINSFKQNRNNKINEIKKKQTNAKSKLIQEINIILSEYATENSISLILNKQTIAAGKKELEITDEIRENLNRKIKEIKIDQ